MSEPTTSEPTTSDWSSEPAPGPGPDGALAGAVPQPCAGGGDTVAMIDGQWDVIWRMRYGPGFDPTGVLVEIERLISMARQVPPQGWQPIYARMVAGLSHFERFWLREHRDDLDAGIAMVAASLLELPSDKPRREQAAAELANAYHHRWLLDGDRESLDLSIAAGEQAIKTFSSGEPMTWLLLHQTHALAFETRWHIAYALADLNRAIVCWRILVEAQSSAESRAWATTHLGCLLRERGELRSDPFDLDEAIMLLRDAMVDDEDAWLRWRELGRAHQVRWRLTGSVASLAAAGRCLDQALCLGVPHDAQPLQVHLERLVTAMAPLMLNVGADAGGVGSASSIAGTLRPLIVRAWGALGADQGEDGLRSELALILAATELWVGGVRRGLLDVAIMRGLLDHAARLCGLPEVRWAWIAMTADARPCRPWRTLNSARRPSRRGTSAPDISTGAGRRHGFRHRTRATDVPPPAR